MHGVFQIGSSELAESYHIPKQPVHHPPHKRPWEKRTNWRTKVNLNSHMSNLFIVLMVFI